MASAPEAPFVYAFAALLAIGSVSFLFVPLLRRIWLFSASRFVFAAVIASSLALSIAAVLAVTYAISDPVYFLPIAGVTVGLRLVSPSLLYVQIRARFEVRRAWPQFRIVLGGAYLVFVGILVYELVRILAGQAASGVAVISEQLVMAVGASLLITRMALRLRPKDTARLWPLWMAATLFGIAFVIVAPYAFPAFEIVYVLSGFVGWAAGVAIVRFSG